MELFEKQARLYKALSHPTRLAILEILRAGEQCVCHMEANLDLRQAYISQQLMVLREAGLIQDRRDGLNIFYRVIEPEVYGVLDATRALFGGSESPEEFRARLHNPKCECPKCKVESSVPVLD